MNPSLAVRAGLLLALTALHGMAADPPRVDAFGEARLDLGECDRRGEQDAARRGAAGKLGHGEKWRASQLRRRIDLRAAAVGQEERAGSAAAVFRNPFGVGEGEKSADGRLRASRPRFHSPLWGGARDRGR